MNNEMKKVGLVFDAEGNIDFIKSLKEVNSELRENYNQFRISQTQWNGSTTAIDKLTNKQQYLTNAYQIQSLKVETLTKQLNELKVSEEENEKIIIKKEKALLQAKIQLEKYATELKEVENKLKSTVLKNEDLVNSLNQIGNTIEVAGKKLSVFSGITVATMGASLKSAIEFESAFTGVEKTVDGTAEQLENLKRGIKDLSKEIPSTTAEISAVAEAAGQLGIETENVLDFTKTMINMGNATNLSAEEAATSLARFANVTNMSQKDFDRLGSTIVALGNNFATTEAEISEMAMNLGAAGSQIGMSQAEIVALATSLSSVGLEAQAGGTAFSKLMVEMQLAVETGNEKLKDFANVAGMSAEQFSEVFKNDATGALLYFIDGLSKSGEQGQSAIKILDDMGITETRLRDSILRSANASEMFNKAIKLGNEAWNDNTALTNEANKRYETLKSKLEIVKNKLLDNAITVGNKLMPVVEKISNKIGNWTDNLSNMNDEQIETILKIGAFVVAVGPAITIIGKLTNGISSSIKSFSTFSDALKVANGSITSSKDAVNNLASIFTKLTSPLGLTVTAISAVTAGLMVYDNLVESSSEKTKKFVDEMNKSTEAYKELKEAQEMQASNELNYIDNTKNLYNELKNITDENGKIKEGYEARANFIINELQKSLGVEITLTDNIISNYQELQKEIEDTIILKKANILLQLSEEKYKNSLQEQAIAYTELANAESEWINKKNEWIAAEEKYEKYVEQGATILAIQQGRTAKNLEKEVQLLEQTRNDKERIYQEHLSNITAYEEGSTIVLSKDLAAINEWSNKKQLILSNNNENEDNLFKKNIEQLSYNINYYKELYNQDVKNKNEAGIIANQNQIKNNEDSLNLLISSMKEQTSTINANSPAIEEAWKTLATNNYNIYKSELDKMPLELKTTIEHITGVYVSSGSQIKDASTEVVDAMLSPFKNGLIQIGDSTNAIGQKIVNEAKTISNQTICAFETLPDGTRNVMKNAMSPMIQEMQNTEPILYTKATNLANGILSRLTTAFDIHSPSRETRKIFKNLMLGMEEGIDDEQTNLYKQTDKLAENVLNSFENLNNKKSNLINSSGRTINTSSQNHNLNIDYNQLYIILLKALNSCKLTLDDDGFIRLIDDRLREVM